MHRPAAATTNRRLMNIAIVNCMSSPVPIQSNAQNVPVAAFGKFFLTHAAPTAGTNKPFAEFRGIIGRGKASSMIKSNSIAEDGDHNL